MSNALTPNHSIGSFIQNFNGGTRPNRFKINGKFPGGDGKGIAFETHCLASTLPDSTLGTIPLPYRGRIYKFPGDRDYQPWAITILDDVSTKDTYANWHAWSQKFNNHATNLAAGSRNHTDKYSHDVTVEMLDHNSNTVIRSFRFSYAWPISVGPLELNMASANTPSSFQVTLAYAYYSVVANSNNIASPITAAPTQ
jgi:hypothetical protein